jgi:23S rRNA (cytidine1920-2'-O)/16S rRNA (cytidine1409-2'-O)-methyltransferase
VKERLDKVLTDKKLVATRSQAKSFIEKGDVTVNGNVVKKAGELVDPSSAIEIHSEQFVGRGAFKLKKALEEFNINVKDKVFLDVGASTGGFTEVLLNEGASKVYAIDVGRDQLAAKLRSDHRVINMEGTNIKDVSSLPEKADGAVMDLSFISITKVLPTVKELLKSSGFLIALVKPQFEVGPQRLPKDGVVKDETLRQEVLKEITEFAMNNGWTHERSIVSPIEGKSGNVEYLSYFIRD